MYAVPLTTPAPVSPKTRPAPRRSGAGEETLVNALRRQLERNPGKTALIEG